MKTVIRLFSKLIFSWQISKDLQSFKNLLKNSKMSIPKVFDEDLNAECSYSLNYLNRDFDLRLRADRGDLTIFYEVFWGNNYGIPTVLLCLENVNNIVDLGANVGLTSIYYGLTYPNAEIYALEADLANYELLKANTDPFENINTLHGAIYKEDVVLNFEQNALAYNSKINFGHTNGITYDVQGYTMFNVMEKFGLQKIDLLKIDIEGAEEFILSENNNWLHCIEHVIIELHGNYDIHALTKDLAPFGFQIMHPPNYGLKMIFLSKVKP